MNFFVDIDDYIRAKAALHMEIEGGINEDIDKIKFNPIDENTLEDLGRIFYCVHNSRHFAVDIERGVTISCAFSKFIFVDHNEPWLQITISPEFRDFSRIVAALKAWIIDERDAEAEISALNI